MTSMSVAAMSSIETRTALQSALLSSGVSPKYGPAICVSLAEALIENTNHLPETDYVRYHAKMRLALAYLFKASQPLNEGKKKEVQKLYLSARKEIKCLLKIVQKHTQELAASISDHADNQEAFKAGETAILLQILGHIKVGLGENSAALDLFERALEQCRAASNLADSQDDARLRNLRDAIMNEIQQIKREAEDLPLAEKAERCREELAQLIDAGAEDLAIAGMKLELAITILVFDPPEYVEGIDLLEEVNEVLHRTLGPSHELTKYANVQINKAKDAYRRHLLKLVGAENRW